MPNNFYPAFSDLSRLRESEDLECKLAAGWDASFLRSPQSGRSWLSPGPGPGLKSPRFVRLAERAKGFGERLATPCARSARRDGIPFPSGGLAPGYASCARSARLTNNETRPSWPTSFLRSPQSGRSWLSPGLSPGLGPGLKSPRFVRLAERAQACAERLARPCARSARRECVFIFSGGLAPGYASCARSARPTNNETRPSWPTSVLRSPQSGRSWLSPGPHP